MKTFAINTLGCKVNQYESQQIRQFLETLGLCQVESLANKPDLAIINTCCVTHKASAKSRQYIRKAQKLNPNSVIVVVGCLPTVDIGELNDQSENTLLVRHQSEIAPTLSRIVDSKAVRRHAAETKPQSFQYNIRTENADEIKHKNGHPNQPKLPPLNSFMGQTRAFLKIQDGCDAFCTYCIIPKTRPFVHSKPPESALKEAQAIVQAGHKEIVLTGVFLGAYGQNSARRKNWDNQRNDKLAELLEKMSQIPGLARIRLSSLEPGDVTPRLLDTICRHRNIMPHLHLSLQSGSQEVLKKMRRQYTTRDFIRTLEAIKSQLDRPAITSDIIVGFPGETEADFLQTIELAKQAGFAKIHVFPFSPRKGTAAAVMKGLVDNRVKKKRSAILRNLNTELERNFRQQFLGQTATVLLENTNGQPCGRSERYFMVYLNKMGKNCKKNELLKVKLTQNSQQGAIGQVETQQSI